MIKDQDPTSLQIAELAVAGLKDKKGLDILLLDMRKVPHAVSDFFVIGTGSSSTNVEALATSVEDMLRMELQEKPTAREGLDNAQWVLLDYFNVVVHIFQEEWREFYALEELWSDAEVTRIED